VAVAAASVLVALAVPSSPHALQQLRGGSQPAGALIFVAAGAGLTLALFPYPVLAAASGLLFGTAAGASVPIAAETLGALAALLIARRTGAAPLSYIGGPRLQRLLDSVGQRGFVTVLYARILPGVPRGIANYAFGMTPVRPGAFTAATALGTAPRALAYAALGRSATDGRLDSPAAIAAVIALVAMGVLGAVLLARRRLL